jgi:hypothetical protein
MLFPFTRVWTPLQRWLGISAGVVALICCGLLIYGYERYYRGPSQSAFFGIWERVSFDSPPKYFEFRPDQTFRFSLSPTMDDVEEAAFPVGKWYAGGPNIYVRFDADVAGPSRPQVWHIVDVSHDEFRVCYFHGGPVYVYKRVVPTATPRI